MITGGEPELNYPPTYVCFHFSNEIWNCHYACCRQAMPARDTERPELKAACDEIKSSFTIINIPLEISSWLHRDNSPQWPRLTDPMMFFFRPDWQMFDLNRPLLSPCHPGSACQSKPSSLSLQGDSSWSRMWRLKDFFVPGGISEAVPFLVVIHGDAQSAISVYCIWGLIPGVPSGPRSTYSKGRSQHDSSVSSPSPLKLSTMSHWEVRT